MLPYGHPVMSQHGGGQEELHSSGSSDSETAGIPQWGNVRPTTRRTRMTRQSLVMDDDVDLPCGDVEDVSRLKGVHWPGMGIFDSATPDMKRKRNQKKSISVAELLQATSEGVEATEMVYDAGWVMRRERPITGNPEEDDGLSPLPGESTPDQSSPPKRKSAARRPRPALVEKDINSGRVMRRRGHVSRPTAYQGGRRASHFDLDDEDDDITYGRLRPKKQRTGLSIHRDNTGPEITFDQPASMDTLTSGFRPARRHQSTTPHLRSGYPGDSANRDRGHQTQPSYPLASGGGFRPANALAPGTFASFGQLNGNPLYTNAPQHNGFGMMPGGGGNSFTPYGQFGIGPNPFTTEHMFSAPNSNPLASANA